MPSPVEEFTAAPLKFLESNLILPGFAELAVESGVIKFGFQKHKQAIASQLGHAIDVYILVPAAASDDGKSFDSYWCPYRQNDLCSTTLGSGANFMFTATMDGCTFGVGSPSPDGAVLVMHANASDYGKESIENQAEVQRTQISLTAGATPMKMLAPKDYRIEMGMGTLSSTTIGIRNTGDGKWSFYSQIYEKRPMTAPPKYFLREAHKKFA